MKRREFLKGLLGGGASILFGRHLPKLEPVKEIEEEAIAELLRAAPGAATGFAYMPEYWWEG